MPPRTTTTRIRHRQALPPVRRSIGVYGTVPVEVHPLSYRTRVTVDEPDLDGTWLVHLAGTTSDPTIFPPDRTMPQLGYDFRDLDLGGEEPPDPFRPFHQLVEDGLSAALARRRPRRLVFVGHSFGGMVGMDFLVRRTLPGLRLLLPTLERVTLVMVCAAHTSPMDRYRIRSDAPVVGPLVTWLSHYVTRSTTTSRERMDRVKRLIGQQRPRALWREAWKSRDELEACWDMPKGASTDHFWAVVRCARAYDVGAQLDAGASLWFDLLILSAELDEQWPADMFTDFWERVREHGRAPARWCHFPGDDHMSVARQPAKYYKEIKDFLLQTA